MARVQPALILEPLTRRQQELRALATLGMGRRSLIVYNGDDSLESLDALRETTESISLAPQNSLSSSSSLPPAAFDLVLLDHYRQYRALQRDCKCAVELLAWGAILVVSDYDRYEVERALLELLGSPHNLQFSLATWWAPSRKLAS